MVEGKVHKDCKLKCSNMRTSASKKVHPSMIMSEYIKQSLKVFKIAKCVFIIDLNIFMCTYILNLILTV